MNLIYGVVFAGAAVSVFFVVLCLRGFTLPEPPPVGVKLTCMASPGTLVNQSLSPTFLARSETAGSADGGFDQAQAALSHPSSWSPPCSCTSSPP